MCRPVVNGVNVAGLCARSPFVNFMREAVVWGASPNFMMMRPNFRYPQL
ncbi:uncharacterized protein CCOS01_09846 [Colletotrichum costaricense]|uniref:Uncharacterized protein n=1 Tax=Colletotrichum costaricense TaxID=1209916 RepID=A0AAI9YSC5_9PEZI|nr:uncharacterized protein CCOS01_09846 [Colletotrichum costaricense]KAK1522134.1 hypothetical protein CCOS01_09846 [Colletotrichum costaricense]